MSQKANTSLLLKSMCKMSHRVNLLLSCICVKDAPSECVVVYSSQQADVGCKQVQALNVTSDFYITYGSQITLTHLGVINIIDINYTSLISGFQNLRIISYFAL